jgi:adenylate kinase
MTRRVVILGAPGAGKGTQARRLSSNHGWPHISTGDIFRSHVEHKTAIGQKIESFMRSGQLVPDTLACQIVVERLAEPDCARGYILDGFPRSVPQAVALDSMLADRHESLDMVILLSIKDEVLIDRLTARRTCPHCGTIYNVRFNPPKIDGQCDKPECDGALLVHRDDDQEDTVRRRLKVYHETTEPLIQHYMRRRLLHRVDGGTSPDLIASQIEDLLREKGAA